MAYTISGPVTVGLGGSLNNIYGEVRLDDVGTSQGTVFYVNSSGSLSALLPDTPGRVLSTNGGMSNPSWINPVSVPTTTGFFVRKSIPLHFSNSEIVIGDWTTTSPIGVSVNPYYNTGVPDFNLVTGVYYVPVDGTYKVSAYIEYINTSPAHGSLKTLSFCEVNSIPPNQSIITTGPKQGTPDTSAVQTIILDQDTFLKAGSMYSLRIKASTPDGTNIINTNTSYSIILVSK